MLIVSGAMLVFGLGAWRALASWLPPGPFDLLHRLPGFVAVGIPSRFWGFLALPLAFSSAIALRRLEAESSRRRPHLALWAGVFLFTLGFQAVSLVLPFVSERGRLVLKAKSIPPAVTTIRNVHGPSLSQSGELAPAIGLMEAYDAHDFIQGSIQEGTAIVLDARGPDGAPVPVTARWDGWSRIRLVFPAGAPAGTAIVFNQNFHPRWSLTNGEAVRDARGNLAARIPNGARPGEALDLVFHDPFSALGSRVSLFSGLAVLAAALSLAGIRLADRLRSKPSLPVAAATLSWRKGER